MIFSPLHGVGYFPSSVTRKESQKSHSGFDKGESWALAWRQTYWVCSHCPIPGLFCTVLLLPAPVAVVRHGSNWKRIVPVSSAPLFATTYSPISCCALKCSFSDSGKPPATACLSVLKGQLGLQSCDAKCVRSWVIVYRVFIQPSELPIY